MASGGSVEVASGYVSLYARMDAAQLVSEITDAMSGLNAASLASGLLNSVGSFADSLGTKLTVLGGAAAIGVAKLADGLFDVISTAENTSIALETMLGSADMASDAMSRLNEFAIKTPYEFSNIANSSKQLLAMGIDFDRQLDESGNGILRWAGNWASALGLNDAGFSNVLTQLGHISAAGKVYTRNLTNLSRNGIAAWQALSDHLGISIDEVRNKVQRGEIDAETAFAAFEEYANTHFLGTMDRMAHTMTGIMSNMGDAIKVPIMALSDTSAYRGLTDAMYELTDPMRELVEALMPSVERVFERVTPLVETFTSRVSEMAESIKRGNPDDLVYGLEAVAMLLGSGPLLKGFGLLSKGVGGFLGMSANVGKGIVSGIMSPLSGLQTFIAKANPVGRISSAFRRVLPTLKAVLPDLANGVGGLVGRTIGNSVDILGSSFRVLGDDVLGLVARASSGFADAGTALSTGVTAGLAKISTGGLSTSFTNILSGVTAGASLVASKFAPVLAKVGSVALKVAGVLKSGLGAAIKATGTSIKVGMAAFSKFAGLLIHGGAAFGIVALGATLAAGAFTAMGGDLAGLGAEIADVLGSVGGTAADALGAFATGLSSLAESGGIQQFFMSLTSGINGFVSQVGAQLPAVLASINAAFPQFVSGLVGMFTTYAPMVLAGAMQLFSGLIGGLTTVIQLLTPAIPGFVSSIASTIAANMPAILNGGVELFMALVDAFVVTVPAVLAELPGLISSLVSALVGNFPRIMDGATQLFNAIADAIPVIVPLAISSLINLLSSLIATFPSWGPRFLSAMGNVLISLLNAIAKAIPNAVSAVKNLLSSARSAIANTNWASLGMNLISGFINGIRNMASAVLSAALSVVQGAANAVRSFLGIASPSKLFREFGEMTMEGFALGIDDGAGDAIDAMDSVMGEMAATKLPDASFGAYAPGGGAGAYGGITNNYYIDGNLVAADAVLASALDTVAQRIQGRTRMGTVR